ncbi:phosphoribosylglycinamide formyltransferase [Athelia psychrophila]|uniref:Phosphoribosylglycinamide formyltransferase n=1 Tax=Athelia psychrophila TaxID=1759441 RepID=A0A166PG19_9AGAM|nr:phosphoribosylglycinamide formyltransferase [Fibularhizoctonia sp. CBS 109695]
MSSQVKTRKLVVLISGGGSNLQALIDAQNTPALPDAQITLVFSNRKAAYGLTRASQASPPIKTGYLALQPFLKANPGKTRDDYDAEVARIVLLEDPDLIILAGWMHVFSDHFLDLVGAQPADRDIPARKSIPVINLHPALPGAFDGTNAIERAYAAFQAGEIKHSGVMVHRVVKEVDRGEPLIVREVEMHQGEAQEAFAERLHKLEWEIIVEASRKVLDETT